MNKFERINEVTIMYVKEKSIFGIGIIYDDQTKRMVVPANDIKEALKKISQLTKEIEYKNKHNEETKE